MFLWEDPQNPTEVKRYVFDWTADLGSDSIATADAELIEGHEAGVTLESTDEFDGVESFVWVSGGTLGEKARIRGTITTTGGQTITDIGILTVAEEADPANATLAQLQADLASLKSARLSLLTGEGIKEVWREGRRIVYNVASVADLDRAIATYEDYVADALAVVTPPARRRMRALSVRF